MADTNLSSFLWSVAVLPAGCRAHPKREVLPRTADDRSRTVLGGLAR